MWTWAVASSYAETNIARTISAPDVEETAIDPLTMDEITALLKACDTARTYKLRQDKNVARVRATAARDRMIIMLLFDTGLRAQEFCDLIIDDLDVGQHKIKVRHGKGDKPRTVRFGKRCAKVIWEYLKNRLDVNTKPTEPLLLVAERVFLKAFLPSFPRAFGGNPELG